MPDRFVTDFAGGTKMKYGVVIVTYNRLELLKECIENCIRQTIPDVYKRQCGCSAGAGSSDGCRWVLYYK